MRANALNIVAGLLLLGVLGNASARGRPVHARDFSVGSAMPYAGNLHPRIEIVPIEGDEGAGAAAGAGKGAGAGAGTGVGSGAGTGKGAGADTGTGVGGSAGTGKDPNAGTSDAIGQSAAAGKDPNADFVPSLRGGGGDSPPAKRVRPNTPPPGADPNAAAHLADAEAANAPKGKVMLDNMQSSIDTNKASVDNQYETKIASYWVNPKSMTNLELNQHFPAIPGARMREFFQARGVDFEGSTSISKIEIFGVPEATVKANPNQYLSVFSMYAGKNPSGDGWIILDRTYRSSADDANLGSVIDSWYSMPVDERIQMSDHMVKQFQAALPDTKATFVGTRNIANQDTMTELGYLHEGYGDVDDGYWDANAGLTLDTDSWKDDFETIAQSSGGSVAIFAKTDYQGEAMFSGIQPKEIGIWYSGATYRDPITGVQVNDIYTGVSFKPKDA